MKIFLTLIGIGPIAFLCACGSSTNYVSSAPASSAQPEMEFNNGVTDNSSIYADNSSRLLEHQSEIAAKKGAYKTMVGSAVVGVAAIGAGGLAAGSQALSSMSSSGPTDHPGSSQSNKGDTVQKKLPCNYCSGRGFYTPGYKSILEFGENKQKCIHCNGTGKVWVK